MSLAYHLTYHKADESGIPSGIEGFTHNPSPKRPYGNFLTTLSEEINAGLPSPPTLRDIHYFLRNNHWSMPYDLMLRWPKKRSWLKALADEDEQRYNQHTQQLPELVVFIIREDAATNPDILQETLNRIEKRFHLLEQIQLDTAAQQRIIRNVRGGNWVEHRDPVPVPPSIAVICYDLNPITFAEDDPRRKKYPMISNAKVLEKNTIRREINELFPQQGHNRIVLHASDNALEAQHHLEAVYGDDYPGICSSLHQSISQLP